MAPVLQAVGLSKRYGGVTALGGVSIALAAGEVHTLLGANGAGKSTLVKILAGIVQPDTGSLELEGIPVVFASPQAAYRSGVATVHQELSLFPQLSVAQNVVIGREQRNRLGWIREDASIAVARALLAQLDVHDIAPGTPVSELSLAQQQLVEIAKAMSFEPRVLILDEPTSALGRSDVERMVRVIDRLRDSGCAIVFISHRMEEVAALSDQVTVLRGGEVVGTMTRATFEPARALELMLGESQNQLERLRPPPPASVPPLLEVHKLRLAGRLAGLSLSVRPGEVVGLAGLEGQGQKELLFALFGLYRHGLQGTVTLGGRDCRATTPRQAIAKSFALIPDDRKAMGGFLGLSVRENVSITVIGRLCRALFIDRRREGGVVRSLVERLAIKCDTPDASLGSLSGGNQQKVVAAKWLAHGAEVYLFCDPTRGVDAGAREMIYATINGLAAEGKAILVYSTDMNEFHILCSRVLVLRGGRIVGSLEQEDITEENILALSFRSPDGMSLQDAA
ncbi:sugar ABC transporter ATP-binding protein [Lichenicola sp.]|uniref:sugar ABC transporter ATP-binding protein n=1 Tax=Lichenicola sp. TaxID=2804529 RepID=UPI003B0061F0